MCVIQKVDITTTLHFSLPKKNTLYCGTQHDSIIYLIYMLTSIKQIRRILIFEIIKTCS